MVETKVGDGMLPQTGNARSHPKREDIGKGSALEVLKGALSYGHVNVGLLTSRTVREYISTV